MRTVLLVGGVAAVTFVGTLGVLCLTDPAKPPHATTQNAQGTPSRSAASSSAPVSAVKAAKQEDTFASTESLGSTEDEGTRRMLNTFRPAIAQTFRYTTVRFSTLHVFVEKTTDSVVACGFFSNEYNANHSFILRGFTNSDSVVVRMDPSPQEMHATRCYDEGSVSYLGSDEFSQ